MDPMACLLDALHRIAETKIVEDPEYRETAVDRLRDLADWLENGGAIPAIRIAPNTDIHVRLSGATLLVTWE